MPIDNKYLCRKLDRRVSSVTYTKLEYALMSTWDFSQQEDDLGYSLISIDYTK